MCLQQGGEVTLTAPNWALLLGYMILARTHQLALTMEPLALLNGCFHCGGKS